MIARPAAVLVASALAIGALAGACRGGEAPGPVEPTTAECPTVVERTCRETVDCGNGQHCTGGHCFSNQAGCPCSTDEGDCGSQAHCTRGQCYANIAGNPCSETRQCGARAHCAVDTCYANASGSPCTDTPDCGSGSACVSGTCN